MGRVSGQTHTQEQLDHYANQHNPSSKEYQTELDNHSDQLNPNNDKYCDSKEKESEKPDD